VYRTHRMKTLALVLVLSFAATAQADRSPVRRGSDEGGTARRQGLDGDRSGRRAIEGDSAVSEEQVRQQQTTRQINLITPPRCGTQRPGPFRRALVDMESPVQEFNIEVWGNEQVYYVLDEIHYFLRSNRDAYVTLFWIGPRGSVFVPFSNLRVEAHRNHKIDPRNIIVEPVGHERWRVIATPQPHTLPCRGSGLEFLQALRRIQSQASWAAGSWDVESRVRRRRSRRRRR